MLEQITKRQHYVPRLYLEAWANGGRVWALHNSKDVINPNIENIMVEKFFYDISELTLDDLKKIHTLVIERQKNIIVKKIQESYYVCLLLYVVEKSSLLQYFSVNGKKSDNYIEYVDKMLFENLYTDIEGETNNIFEKIRNGQTSFLKNPNDVMFQSLVKFFSVQNMRTKAVRKRILDGNDCFANYFTHPEVSINIVMFLFSWALWYNLLQRAECGKEYIILLQNNTNVDFITSDRPVINLKAVLGHDHPPKELELYCPIGPKMALIITDNKEYSTICSLEQVEYLNQRIVEFHSEWLVAKEKESLKKYINFSGR